MGLGILDKLNSRSILMKSCEIYGDSYFIISLNGVYLDFVTNDQDLKYQVNTILNKKLSDVLPEDIAETHLRLIRKVHETGKNQKINYSILIQEQKKHYQITYTPYQENSAILAIVRNVTELKRQETTANIEKVKMKNILHSMEDGVYIIDQEYNITFLNRFIEEEFGHKSTKKCYEYFLNRTEPCTRCELEGILNGKCVKKKYHSHITNKIYQVASKPLTEVDGKISKLSIMRDVTESTLMKQKLKKEKELALTYFEIAEVILLVLNSDETIQKINKKGCDIIGLSKFELIGKNWFDNFIPTNKRTDVRQIFQQILSGKIDYFRYHEDILIDKNGNEHLIAWHNTVLRNENGKIVATLSSGTDITEQRKYEQRLKLSEQKYRSLVENAQEGIWRINASNYTTFANRRMGEMLGYAVEEMLGRDLFSFMDEKQIEKCKKNVERRKQGIKEQHEFIFTHKTGKKIYTRMETSPLFNNNGKYIGALACVADITEHKLAELKLQESEEMFRTITEQSLIGICIFQNGTIQYLNDAYANIYGYSKSEMKDFGIADLKKIIHPNDYQFVYNQLLKKQKGDLDVKVHYQLRGIKKNKEVIWLDNYSKTIFYNGSPADLVILIDITKEKQAEQELRKLNRLRSEFLDRISHELKTPLTTIKGYTDIIINQFSSHLNPSVMEFLDQIQIGIQRLNLLIKKILDASKAKSNKLEINKHPYNLVEVIQESIENLRGLIKLRGHKIKMDVGEPQRLIATFDREKILQVIENLISNAIKFTPPHGKIRITAQKNDKTEEILVAIQDNGIGLTEEEKNLIFSEFGKIEHFGRGIDVITEGSGLGLFLSKKIIQRHDGYIWIESEGRNKGSTVFFTLPYS
ncbi:MAG: putative Histidine kinase [Promethearchaeota archaeon]|nr:MAG: putative Histidine kinase [Candidatus Lokiarchaeota archaeon]